METNVSKSTNIKDLIQEMNSDGYIRDRFRVCIRELDRYLKENSFVQQEMDAKYIWGSKVIVDLQSEIKDVFSDHLLSNVREFFEGRKKFIIKDIDEADFLDLMYEPYLGYKKVVTSIKLLVEAGDIQLELYEEFDDVDGNETEIMYRDLEPFLNVPNEEVQLDRISLPNIELNEVPDFSLIEEQGREFLSGIIKSNNAALLSISSYQKQNEKLMDEVKKKDDINIQINEELKSINKDYEKYRIASEEEMRDFEEQVNQMKQDIYEKSSEITNLSDHQIRLEQQKRDLEIKVDEERKFYLEEKNAFIVAIKNHERNIILLKDEILVRQEELKYKDQENIDMSKLYEEEIETLNINLAEKEKELKETWVEIESLNIIVEDYKNTIKDFGTLRKLIEKIANKI